MPASLRMEGANDREIKISEELVTSSVLGTEAIVRIKSQAWEMTSTVIVMTEKADERVENGPPDLPRGPKADSLVSKPAKTPASYMRADRKGEDNEGIESES